MKEHWDRLRPRNLFFYKIGSHKQDGEDDKTRTKEKKKLFKAQGSSEDAIISNILRRVF